MDAHIWPLSATINSHGHLMVGGCDTVGLAQEYGTPLYLLDAATFRAHCQAYKHAFAHHYPGDVAIHYASKALLNTGIAQLLHHEGMALDVVSGGELWVALRAGFSAAHIHLHGNAKPRAELEQALAAGIGNVVVDTLDELELLAALTGAHVAPQSILLRIAPGVAADTHAHIQTGQADSKFGLPLDQLDAAAAMLKHAPGLWLRGLHCHLGSQLFDPAPYPRAIDVLLEAAIRLRDQHGIVCDEISPGGGLGVPYTADQPTPDIDLFAATICRAMVEGCQRRNFPLPTLVVEPGRSIVARAGVAIYSVLARKIVDLRLQIVDSSSPSAELPENLQSQICNLQYLHVDGGMADNIRPSLYGATYTALLANRADADADTRVHVSGRYCESGDVLLRDVLLPASAPGDLVAVAVAGAYTLSMASNYNLVPRPALLLVENGQVRVMQRRETYQDLVRRDEDIR